MPLALVGTLISRDRLSIGRPEILKSIGKTFLSGWSGKLTNSPVVSLNKTHGETACEITLHDRNIT